MSESRTVTAHGIFNNIREDPYELYKVDDNYYIIQDSDVGARI